MPKILHSRSSSIFTAGDSVFQRAIQAIRIGASGDQQAEHRRMQSDTGTMGTTYELLSSLRSSSNDTPSLMTHGVLNSAPTASPSRKRSPEFRTHEQEIMFTTNLKPDKQKSCSPATYCTLLSLWRKTKSTSAHDHRAVACTHELQTREVIKGRSTGESNVLLNEILLKQAQYKWVTTKIDLLFENDAWGYLHPVTGWEGQSQTRVRAAQFEGEPHCSGAPQTPASIQHQAIHDGCLLSLIIRHKQM